MAFLDNTGLYIKYGTENAVPLTGGEYKTHGELREIELKIDLTTLTTANVIQNDQLFFPKNVVVQEVELYVDTAAATGTAVNIGLIGTDRSTEVDFDGLIAAEVTATLTAGKKLVYSKGTSKAGALIGGSANSTVGYICAARTDSTAFTAGVVRVRIRYFRP